MSVATIDYAIDELALEDHVRDAVDAKPAAGQLAPTLHAVRATAPGGRPRGMRRLSGQLCEPASGAVAEPRVVLGDVLELVEGEQHGRQATVEPAPGLSSAELDAAT